MKKREKAFAASWFFAPYLGSADLDFFKRIKNCKMDFDVVQVRRDNQDTRVLDFIDGAHIKRFEVSTDHRNPRTRATRDDFHRAALEIFNKNRDSYDLIVSHSNEVPSHRVAMECKRRAPNLPWVAYFGDVVAANPFVKFMTSYPLNDDDCATEAETIKRADVIICNNRYQRDAMFVGELAKYANKSLIIPHCFDPGMFPRTKVRANKRFTFMHVGTLYHIRRTATPVLQAIDRLLEIYPQYADSFEVVFWGGGYYQNDLDTHARMRHPSHARLNGSVSYMESLKLMRTADVLLNIDGIFHASEGVPASPFFPGKLTDYMGARKPIMSITMPVGPTTDLMKASGNLTADERLDRIAYVMKRYIDGKVPYSFDAYRRYEVSVVGHEMEQAFRASLSGPAAVAELKGRLEQSAQTGLRQAS